MIKSNAQEGIGLLIRQLREASQLPLRNVAVLLDIDTSLYSKIERGERNANKDQIHKLEVFFNVKKDFLMVPILSEKIFTELSEEDCANEVLKITEKRVKNKSVE
jgi:transcriptional regulator with XRE-family HTH domain